MYAVVATGGKQYRVEEGGRIDVERLDAQPGDEVDLTPVLVVDGADVLGTPSQIAAASVKGRIIDEHRGPKITGFTYKNKSNERRRWGHRQAHSTVEIVSIRKG